MIVRINITSNEYEVTPYEKKGIPRNVGVSDLSKIQL